MYLRSSTLLALGVALTIAWLALNLALPDLYATGLPSLASRVLTHAALLCGLWLALRRAGYASGDRVAAWLFVALPLTLWLVAAWTLAQRGYFAPVPGELRVRLPVAIFGPLLLGIPLVRRSRAIARVLDATPASWLVGLQIYRLVGGIFLLGWLDGRIAAVFAWPAGVGDVLVGVLALPAAAAAASETASGRRAATLWNVLGIVDLAVAVTMGVLTSPGPLQRFGFEITAPLLGTFPSAVTPAFVVPSSILLHALSLRQLARRGAGATLPHARPSGASELRTTS